MYWNHRCDEKFIDGKVSSVKRRKNWLKDFLSFIKWPNENGIHTNCNLPNIRFISRNVQNTFIFRHSYDHIEKWHARFMAYGMALICFIFLDLSSKYFFNSAIWFVCMFNVYLCSQNNRKDWWLIGFMVHAQYGQICFSVWLLWTFQMHHFRSTCLIKLKYMYNVYSPALWMFQIFSVSKFYFLFWYKM